MSSKTILKTYFNTGDIPTEAQFADLIDSNLNLLNDDISTLTAATDLTSAVVLIAQGGGLKKAAATLFASGGGGGLADPGANGIMKRTALNTTAVAVAGTDFEAPISVLPISKGGTGTATPGLVQGTNITITGAWPNQTVNSTGGASLSFGYTALTANQASYSIDNLSQPFTKRTLSITSATAITIAETNMASGGVLILDVTKSFTGTCTITFPVGSTVLQEGIPIAGAQTALSSASAISIYSITVEKIGTGVYRVYSKQIN